MCIAVILKVLVGRNWGQVPWFLWAMLGFAVVVVLIRVAFDAMPSGGSKQSKAAGDGL